MSADRRSEGDEYRDTRVIDASTRHECISLYEPYESKSPIAQEIYTFISRQQQLRVEQAKQNHTRPYGKTSTDDMMERWARTVEELDSRVQELFERVKELEAVEFEDEDEDDE